ncbi:MAG: NifB/NifX family molybdenum-iron cluster-binding protein [Thermoplasmata archaeon]
MIIGIPTDDGVTVSKHFGRSKNFLIVNIEKGKVLGKKLEDNPHDRESDDPTGHGRVLKLLTDNKVKKVICYNLNTRMEDNLASLKITVKRAELNTKIDEILREEVNNTA